MQASKLTHHRRQLVPNGIQELWTTVSRHRLRYLSGGSGPAVILVSGLLGFSFSWSENLPSLAERFTVYAPDLLNTGYSDRYDEPGNLRSSVAQIFEFMDALEISSANFIGSSYGGTLIMAAAAIAPERVERMVLVSPSHPISEKRGRWQAILFSSRIGAFVAKNILPFAPQFLFGFFLDRMYGDSSRILPGTIEEYTKAIKVPGTTTAAAQVMKSWRANFRELAALMPKLAETPTLLIWGDKDRIVPLRTAESLQQTLKNSLLQVIKTAGHIPYEELPEEFNRVVTDYLCSGSPRLPLASDHPRL